METQQHMDVSDAEDEDTTTIINYQNFEEVFIKEEPQEENSEDRKLYENVLLSVKKEEYDSDEQIDKTCENPITTNDIQKIEGFYCAVCNKSFTHKTSLIRHMKIHEGIKKFQCFLCNKTFLEKCYLKAHVKIHNGVKDFKCTVCNKQFTFSGTLSKHSKIHTGIRAYKCPTCNRSFVLNSHLKSHMKTHSGIKEYKCVKCNKLFTRNSTLLKHNKAHTKNEPVSARTIQVQKVSFDLIKKT